MPLWHWRRAAATQPLRQLDPGGGDAGHHDLVLEHDDDLDDEDDGPQDVHHHKAAVHKPTTTTTHTATPAAAPHDDDLGPTAGHDGLLAGARGRAAQADHDEQHHAPPRPHQGYSITNQGY